MTPSANSATEHRPYARPPLSRTTVAYAKWIHSGEDEPDHRGQTLATRSPHVIRTWADARDAVPVIADAQMLLLDFPSDGGGGDGGLRSVAWNDWFDAFEERELVFLYQETLANGRQSNFFRLDSPEPPQQETRLGDVPASD